MRNDQSISIKNRSSALGQADEPRPIFHWDRLTALHLRDRAGFEAKLTGDECAASEGFDYVRNSSHVGRKHDMCFHVNIIPVVHPRMMLDMSEMADRLRIARIHAGYAKTKDAAEALGVAPSTYAAHENGQNNYKEPAANAYGRKFGVRPAWLLLGEEPMLSSDPVEKLPASQPHRSAHKPNASFPPRYTVFSENSVPLMGQTSGGANGRFVLNGQKVRDLFCPPDLDGVEDAYAVQVYGYSMEPKFEAGEIVWLNPHAPVRRGDYVVVQVQDPDDGEELSSYIKQFISRGSGRLRLRQFNPEEGETEELEFPDDLVLSIHKIVFHALA